MTGFCGRPALSKNVARETAWKPDDWTLFLHPTAWPRNSGPVDSFVAISEIGAIPWNTWRMDRRRHWQGHRDRLPAAPQRGNSGVQPQRGACLWRTRLPDTKVPRRGTPTGQQALRQY